MNVIKIIKAHLIAGGFDGLGCEECSCELSDLNPCGESFSNCEPGHKVIDGDDWFINVPKEDEKS
jgi:hypothetical protein